MPYVDLPAVSITSTTTLTDGANLAAGTVTGSSLGNAITQKVSTYGVTPVVQRAGASQAAVVGTAATNVTPFGFSQVQADAIVTLVNELRAALVAFGIINGAA